MLKKIYNTERKSSQQNKKKCFDFSCLFKKCDTLPYAEDETLKEKLEELFGKESD